MTEEEMQLQLQTQMKLYVEQLKKEYAELDEKPSFEAAEEQVVMLPMSDGIRLYTVCRAPVGKGPFPTVIVRGCYPHQESSLKVNAEEYCKRGFAYVYQYCRGTASSEGIWEPNVNDRQDGKTTLDWLNAQDWVENIGYFGSSYLAFTGWILADIVPEKVKTLYLTHYGTDRFASAYQNGLFRQDVLTSWAMENAGFPVTADYLTSVQYRPQIHVDEALWGKKIDWYRDWITNTSRDDRYWQTGFWKQLKEIPGKVKIPVYIGSGWYDHHLGSALKTYEDLSPESKRHSLFRIGAWNHFFMPCVEGADAQHLENSDVKSAFHWFDTILRKKQLPKGKVLTYEIGADQWQENKAFPFLETSKQVFYFNALNRTGNAYELLTSLDTRGSSVSYMYDPDNPVRTHGAESVLRTMEENGSKLQPDCGWREDVISFVSAPLQTDINILGKIKVKLYASSSAEDTAFAAKIMEVHPDGKAYNIRSSITTLAYRDGPDSPRAEYTPHSIVQAEIVMWDISWKLKKGSKLRIDITSSDCPEYSVHTNNAGIWSLQEAAKKAKQTLYCGAEYPTQVILPINE